MSVLHPLEDAGYDPCTYDKLIGCYAGASVNFYWQWKSLLRGEVTWPDHLKRGNYSTKNIYAPGRP